MKKFNLTLIFSCKELWDFNKKEEYDNIIKNWQMTFQASDFKNNHFLNLLDNKLYTSPYVSSYNIAATDCFYALCNKLIIFKKTLLVILVWYITFLFIYSLNSIEKRKRKRKVLRANIIVVATTSQDDIELTNKFTQDTLGRYY